MKTIELLGKYAELLKEKAENILFKERHRKSTVDFIRKKKTGFAAVVKIMLNFKTKSNALSVYNFTTEIEKTESYSRQAYEAARNKVKSSAFKEMFEDSVEMSLSVEDPVTYCGYRLGAVDGSLVLLPTSEALTKKYGAATPVEGKTYARISLCADVLNGVILDGELAGFSTGERKLALKHIEKDLHSDLLYLYDRGYWSPELVASMCDRNQKFLMRLAANSVPQVTNSKDNNGYFVTKHKGKEYSIRYYKFELSSGEMEYLATNVSENEIPDEKLPELYSFRWGVETKYDELKNRLQFENFSGKSVNVIEQEFYASMITMNITAFAVAAADTKVKEERIGKKNKHQYKPNGNMAAGILKDRFIKAVITDDPVLRKAMIDKLISDISKYVIPIIPNRHFPRAKSKAKQRKSRKYVNPL